MRRRQATLRFSSSTETSKPVSRVCSPQSVRFQTTTLPIGAEAPRSTSHQGAGLGFVCVTDFPSKKSPSVLPSIASRACPPCDVEDCRAVELSTAALQKLYRHDPHQFALIHMNMGREVCRRLREMDEKLFSVQDKSAWAP